MISKRLQVKSLKVILKDFESIIRGWDKNWRLWLLDGNNLKKKTDKIPIEWWWEFRMRYRESWWNWLLCATLSYTTWMDVTFADDEKLDWIILDKKTGTHIITEHVAALEFPKWIKLPKWEARIISAIEHKIRKWPDYAKWKCLVVFFDWAWEIFINRVGKAISGKHSFLSIFCLWLCEWNDQWYTYSVSQLWDLHSPTYLVHINSDFTDWKVDRYQ